MSQPWQPQYNPGNQPPVPPQPPAPPQGFGAPPPAPGQFPVQPGYPYQAPYAPQPRSGNPVGAFFLGLLVSIVIAALYSLVWYGTYEDLTKNTTMTLYVVHALLNGAAVGAVVGLVGRSRTGAHISGVLVAMLGTFFGYTNGIVLITADSGGWFAFKAMMRDAPFYPAEVWWGSANNSEWHTLLGLLAAAAAAWGLAFLIGRSRR
ncbi:hypothetical protein [Streptomyces sp. ISL-100]|uniref:hypothetical protein n=1 Tax=Streptomyces sp. ISL-100 TaxID=2819173 RepID=UPI001BED2923|nr:hypothetical protein [Streptomyces sp. ISL-100]MBT2395205.1 hypothetical protein [Streptomyces sp. ISL-100]